MITVPDGTKIIIERSRYLSEALSKKLINISSLAEYIKPELEEMLMKEISTGSIIMAITRLQPTLKPKYKQNNLFKKQPEMLVRSGLSLVSIQRTKESEEAIRELFIKRVKGTFFSITIGSTEINIAVSSGQVAFIESRISKSLISSIIPNVSLITIFLPEKAIETPGVYYFFLKSIAWEGINILGNAATTTELTLFFDDKDVHRAFEVLSSIYREK